MNKLIKIEIKRKTAPKKMKILMIGWEFPPIYSGGLGVVSKKLATEISVLGAEIVFAIPHFIRDNIDPDLLPTEFEMVDFSSSKFSKNISIKKIPAGFESPYVSEEGYKEIFEISERKIHEKGSKKGGTVYGRNLWEEINRFAVQVEILLKENKYKDSFDIIHAHDWITFEAGIRAKIKLNVPLVLHIHSTEIDRTGGNPNPEIFNREKHALDFCDKVLAVSEFTKNILIEKYDISAEKITVVYNALRTKTQTGELQKYFRKTNKFTVLFVGRMTIQKGPDYFFQVAKKVLEKTKKIQFIFAGNGDMLPKILNKIIYDKLHKNIFCLGFLGPKEKRKAYENADLMIVPSVSEPFGLIGLEAVEYGVPVILTKNSGVREVVRNSLQSDFWDIKKMADFVLAAEKYPVIRKVLAEKAFQETRRLSWENQALEIYEIYKKLLK